MVVITSDQREVIFDAVESMYTAVATDPGRGFHFPTGRPATEYVGYPAQQLDQLPPEAVESFAGVGYPFAADVITSGATVVDIGSGSGTDLILAALLTGPDGAAIGIDMTRAMREKAMANARRAGLDHVQVLEGNAEELPLRSGCADVITSNGVINLVPNKRGAIREMYRVLKPGGWVQLADIVVQDLPSAACRAQPQLWAECIVGATTQTDYLALFTESGFTQVEHLSDLDYFAASASESTRATAGGFGAHSMVMRAHKPA